MDEQESTPPKQQEKITNTSRDKLDLPNDEIDTNKIFESLINNLDPEKLKSGVYTEVHLLEDGQLCITPDISDYPLHKATTSGNHSMWESKELIESETNLEAYPDQVKLSTQSLVAKGEIHKDESGIRFRLDNQRNHTYHQRKTQRHNQIFNDQALYIDLVNTAQSLGIEVSQIHNGVEKNLEYNQIPKLNLELSVTGVDTGIDTEIRSGFLKSFYFEQYTTRYNSDTEIKINPKVLAEIDIVEGAARTHQQLAESISGEGSDTLDVAHVHKVTINGIDASLSCRHSFDPDTKRLSIELLISELDEMNSIDNDFEYSVFIAYLKALSELDVYNIQNLSIVNTTTSIKLNDGRIGIRQAESQFSEILSQAHTKKITQARLARTIYKFVSGRETKIIGE